MQLTFQSVEQLLKKVVSYAQELQVIGCHAWNGWLERLKARFNVSFKAIPEEEHAAIPEMTNAWWKTHLPKSLLQIDLKDIYNADEFTLFWTDFIVAWVSIPVFNV